MATGHATDFCGREAELGALQAAFADVARSDGGPRLILLLGDSGVGKTRLVRHFYHHLATRIDAPDPDGYWPDELDDGLNPAARALSPQHHPPFLWLGIACRQHNDGLEGLDLLIGPHIDPILTARQRREFVEDAGRAAAKAALGPFSGLVDAWEWLRRARKSFGRPASADTVAQANATGTAAPSPPKAVARRIDESVDSLLDCLADLLDAPSGATDWEGQGRALDRRMAGRQRIPAVIFLDDAQWLGINPAKRELVVQLLDRARARRWPLLLVAAHWHSEWLRDSDADTASFAARAAEWARADDPAWRPLAIDVQDGDVYRPLLAALLPGLTREQQDVMLRRAGGNPRALTELAAFARDNPRLFMGLDPDAALSDEGLAEVAAMEVDLERLIRRRINQAPPGVRQATSIAALQGMEFLAPLTVEAARALGLAASADDVAAIERPHALAEAERPGIYAFAQALYRDVALANLPNVLSDPAAARAGVIAALRAQLADATALAAMERSQRNLLHHLGIALCADDPATVPDRAMWWLALAGDAASRFDYATALMRFDMARGLDPLTDPAMAGHAPKATVLVPALLDAGRVAEARAYADWRLAGWHLGQRDAVNPGFEHIEFDATYADISRRDGLGEPAALASAKQAMGTEATDALRIMFDQSPELVAQMQRFRALDDAVADADARGDWDAFVAAAQAALDAQELDDEPDNPNRWRFGYFASLKKRRARRDAAFGALRVAVAADAGSARTARAADRALQAARADFDAALRYANAPGLDDFPHPPWDVRGQALLDMVAITDDLLEAGLGASAHDALNQGRRVVAALLDQRSDRAAYDVAGHFAHTHALVESVRSGPVQALAHGAEAIERYDAAQAIADNAKLRLRLTHLLTRMAQWAHSAALDTAGDWTDDALAAIRALPADAANGAMLGELTEMLMAAAHAHFAAGQAEQGEGFARDVEARIAAAPALYDPAYRNAIAARLAAWRAGDTDGR